MNDWMNPEHNIAASSWTKATFEDWKEQGYGQPLSEEEHRKRRNLMRVAMEESGGSEEFRAEQARLAEERRKRRLRDGISVNVLPTGWT